MYEALANAVLVLHAAVVLFVVGGLVLVVAGNAVGWRWVNGSWFRILHLAAIATVVGQSWLGITCPLTTLESWLRLQAGSDAYAAGFLEHWLHRLLFFEAPAWVFVLVYSVFFLLVIASWWLFPPRLRRVRQGEGRSASVAGSGHARAMSRRRAEIDPAPGRGGNSEP